MAIDGNFATFRGRNMGCHQSATKVYQNIKEWDAVLKSVKTVKGHQQWFLINNNYQKYVT